MTIISEGHPIRPETFSFQSTAYDHTGEITRVHRSFISYDSRWPWWRVQVVKMLRLAINRIAIEMNEDRP